ncbi:MAG: DUF2793 domain-containing protein [Pseudomonadota bacterium]
MAETRHFGLVLLEEAQAQKHVSVNEALLRLDAISSRRLASFGVNVPPIAVDGDVHLVGSAPSGDWSGKAGQLAVATAGGWEFAAPWTGLKLWDASQSVWRFFDGADWRADAGAVSLGGAASLSRIAEIDHTITAGATSSTLAVIPDKAVVIGVTGRVLDAIGGASSWQLGVAGAPDRYGSGIGTAAGAFAHGVTGSPLAYFGATSLLLTATGGNFTDGSVRLAVHFMTLEPPV